MNNDKIQTGYEGGEPEHALDALVDAVIERWEHEGSPVPSPAPPDRTHNLTQASTESDVGQGASNQRRTPKGVSPKAWGAALKRRRRRW